MIVSVVLLEPLMALLCRYAKHQPRKYNRVCYAAFNKCFPIFTCSISSEVKPTGSWKRQKGQLSGSFQHSHASSFTNTMTYDFNKQAGVKATENV